jgi:GH25 family lysozyme M1 (1,4-beta-N-acetylmuramidase)
MKLDVIDVSSWQGNIDFAKVKEAGISAVIIRCGFTGYRTSLPVTADDMFEKNYSGAIANGLAVGVYYYSCATSESKAQEEANFTLQQIKGKKITYPVYFDTEDNHDVSASGVNPHNQVTIGRDNLTALAKIFCGAIRDAGYIAGVYSSKSWLETHIDMSQLSEYECWVAQYYSQNLYSGTYQMWQYSSAGSVPGVSTNVDMNYCYKDYAATVPQQEGLVQYPLQSSSVESGFDFPSANSSNGFQYGLSLSSGQSGPPQVLAAHSGTIVLSDSDAKSGSCIVVLGYYNEAVDILTRYTGLSESSASEGNNVDRGQAIASLSQAPAKIGFETWLVPKNYRYNPADQEQYAVDPMAICRVLPGQTVSVQGKTALPYPSVEPADLAGLTDSSLQIRGEGVGIYAEPSKKYPPIASGYGRARSKLQQLCGNLQYSALKKGSADGSDWALVETCYGQFWAPVETGNSAITPTSPDNPGDCCDVIQNLAKLTAAVKKAMTDMEAIKALLPEDFGDKK